MATLATCFRTALSCIEPSDDARNAAAAHQLVTAALKADDRLTDLGVSPFLIGSYGRDVSITRVKDVDVFVRLALAGASLRPGDILNHVTDVLEAAFPGRVERQHRSVKVDFPDEDLSVDVVIARPCVDHPVDEFSEEDSGHWQIPQRIEDDGRASWIETDPIRMGTLTTIANQTYLLSEDSPGSGVYVPMVKLIRQIRRTWVQDQPGGYYFEVCTHHAFQALTSTNTTVAGYLTVILREIADRLPDYAADGLPDPTLDGRTIATKATPAQLQAATDRIREAADLAENALAEEDPCRSALLWRQLLGKTHHTINPDDVFPLPDYCNADGTTKAATSSRTKGAPAVPAGSDRYA